MLQVNLFQMSMDKVLLRLYLNIKMSTMIDSVQHVSCIVYHITYDHYYT